MDSSQVLVVLWSNFLGPCYRIQPALLNLGHAVEFRLCCWIQLALLNLGHAVEFGLCCQTWPMLLDLVHCWTWAMLLNLACAVKLDLCCQSQLDLPTLSKLAYPVEFGPPLHGQLSLLLAGGVVFAFKFAFILMVLVVLMNQIHQQQKI